ncbi:MAG: PqqD family protein [Phycisphaerae bacterium]|nr:PqqD family protein [Phycisphaerae bacterium]
MKGMAPESWTHRHASIVVPRRRHDLIVEELDGQAILSDPVDGSTHRLNATALEVWRWCDGCRTTLQIADRLTARYEVEFEVALNHVDQLMASFAQLHLFEPPCH